MNPWTEGPPERLEVGMEVEGYWPTFVTGREPLRYLIGSAIEGSVDGVCSSGSDHKFMRSDVLRWRWWSHQ